MFEDDFTKMLIEHPECKADRRTFSSYMKDLFPEEKLRNNVLSDLVEIGIVRDIESNSELDATFSYRYVKTLVDNFGTGEENAENAVYIWCQCYGKHVLGKRCDLTPHTAKRTEASRAEKGLYQDYFSYQLNDDRSSVTGCSDSNAKTLVVPAILNNHPMKLVETSAFENMWNIEQAVLAEGYTEVGTRSFAKCKNLRQMILPYGVTRIGEEAYALCENLTTCNLVESLISIGAYAFQQTKLRLVQFPKSLMSIGNGLFKDCYYLEYVVWNLNIGKIPAETFSGCISMKEFEIFPTVERIESRAFAGCSGIRELYIPDSVVFIADDAFIDMSEDFTINCDMGSEAERFARSHKIKYTIV